MLVLVVSRLDAKEKGGLSAALCGCAKVTPWHDDETVALFRYEHPVVDPHVSHFMHVPFRTSVKLPHSEHISPS